ncbi:MAG: hypothetical protein PHH28_07490 [Desulfuromonadaceae bacterium]|nr:hypothetical protein [Desulfuromonadaceae bacterium]
MELEYSEMVRKSKVTILGIDFSIEVFLRENGKSFALTRYTHEDVIITDGRNSEDAFRRHRQVLPLAIGCRIKNTMSAGHKTQH